MLSKFDMSKFIICTDAGLSSATNRMFYSYDGEVAELNCSYIDQSVIEYEEKYDGFYAVCTNLDESIRNIVKANQRRLEIEECFRNMKTDFESRLVYLNRQNRIFAHFITCFIALIIYRYLEKKLDHKYTITQILSALQEMDFVKHERKGYQPIYTKSELTNSFYSLKISNFGLKLQTICIEQKIFHAHDYKSFLISPRLFCSIHYNNLLK